MYFYFPKGCDSQSYANIIIKFVNDWYKNPAANKAEPIYILEIGAGQGRLAYLILKKLMTMTEYFPKDVERPFVYDIVLFYQCSYVVSDYTAESILQMKSHAWYSTFVKQGVVDFAVVDCESSAAVTFPFIMVISYDQITLELANKKLTPEVCPNPLFVIANYVFSSLRSDVLRVENSTLLRGLLSLRCPQESSEVVNKIPSLQ